MTAIPGAQPLVRIFGYWPTFHDAEVIRFGLDRGPPTIEGPTAEADILVFEITKEVSPSGQHVLRHHTLVTIRFRGVTDLQLDGFNGQNALMGLNIHDITDRQLEGLRYEVNFEGSYGMGAHFLCRGAEVVRVQPWDPTTRSPAA